MIPSRRSRCVSNDVVRELEVYKMLARLGIELGAGVIPRYGLMSVAVPLSLEEGMTGVAFALCQRAPECGAASIADEDIGLDPALCGALAAISKKH
jgi:hypothetical protein